MPLLHCGVYYCSWRLLAAKVSIKASMKVVFPASTNAQSRVEAKVHVRQHSDSE